MEQLINDIFEELKDFRADENNPSVQMTKNRIRQWINQFDENERIFILTELKSIIDKRYCTKQNAYDFLKGSLETLKQHYNYASVQDFLSDRHYNETVHTNDNYFSKLNESNF